MVDAPPYFHRFLFIATLFTPTIASSLSSGSLDFVSSNLGRTTLKAAEQQPSFIKGAIIRPSMSTMSTTIMGLMGLMGLI